MMTWNYRVVQDEDGFFVTDVYYEGGKPKSWGERHCVVQGKTLSDVHGDYEKVQEALQKPVLRVVGHTLEENA